MIEKSIFRILKNSFKSLIPNSIQNSIVCDDFKIVKKKKKMFERCDRRSLHTSHWTRQPLVPEPSWRRGADWRCVSHRRRVFFDDRAEPPVCHPTLRWNGASKSRGLTWIPSTNRPATVPRIPTSSTKLTSPPGALLPPQFSFDTSQVVVQVLKK